MTNPLENLGSNLLSQLQQMQGMEGPKVDLKKAKEPTSPKDVLVSHEGLEEKTESLSKMSSPVLPAPKKAGTQSKKDTSADKSEKMSKNASAGKSEKGSKSASATKSAETSRGASAGRSARSSEVQAASEIASEMIDRANQLATHSKSFRASYESTKATMITEGASPKEAEKLTAEYFMKAIDEHMEELEVEVPAPVNHPQMKGAITAALTKLETALLNENATEFVEGLQNSMALYESTLQRADQISAIQSTPATTAATNEKVVGMLDTQIDMANTLIETLEKMKFAETSPEAAAVLNYLKEFAALMQDLKAVFIEINASATEKSQEIAKHKTEALQDKKKTIMEELNNNLKMLKNSRMMETFSEFMKIATPVLSGLVIVAAIAVAILFLPLAPFAIIAATLALAMFAVSTTLSLTGAMDDAFEFFNNAIATIGDWLISDVFKIGGVSDRAIQIAFWVTLIAAIVVIGVLLAVVGGPLMAVSLVPILVQTATTVMSNSQLAKMIAEALDDQFGMSDRWVTLTTLIISVGASLGISLLFAVAQIAGNIVNEIVQGLIKIVISILKKMITGMADAMKDIGSETAKLVVKIIIFILKIIKVILENINNIFGMITKVLKLVILGALKKVFNGIAKVIKELTKQLKVVMQKVMTVVNEIKDLILSVIQEITNTLMNALQMVGTAITGVTHFILMGKGLEQARILQNLGDIEQLQILLEAIIQKLDQLIESVTPETEGTGGDEVSAAMSMINKLTELSNNLYKTLKDISQKLHSAMG